MRKIDRALARLPFAPVVAALFAIVAIVLVMATPQWLFERWVGLSGIASIIPAAVPPLGETARLVGALAAGLATGAVVWLLVTIGDRLLHRASRVEEADDYVSDSASGRRPLFAGNELGAPLMSDEAIAQARDELILETPLEDDKSGANGPITTSDDLLTEPDIRTSGVHAIPELGAPEPPPGAIDIMSSARVHLRPTETETIPALLERLDAALACKPLSYRPDRGDVAQLRKALGR